MFCGRIWKPYVSRTPSLTTVNGHTDDVRYRVVFEVYGTTVCRAWMPAVRFNPRMSAGRPEAILWAEGPSSVVVGSLSNPVQP